MIWASLGIGILSVGPSDSMIPFRTTKVCPLKIVSFFLGTTLTFTNTATSEPVCEVPVAPRQTDLSIPNVKQATEKKVTIDLFKFCLYTQGNCRQNCWFATPTGTYLPLTEIIVKLGN